MVAKVRERLAVSKPTERKCDGERFYLRKLVVRKHIRLRLKTGLQLWKT